MKKQLDTITKQVEKSNKDRERVETQIATLCLTVERLRNRLKECQDPKTISNWLEEELKEQL